jgi:hypothetical protein
MAAIRQYNSMLMQVEAWGCGLLRHTDIIRLIPLEPHLQVMAVGNQVVEVFQQVLALAGSQAVDFLGECSCRSDQLRSYLSSYHSQQE